MKQMVEMLFDYEMNEYYFRTNSKWSIHDQYYKIGFRPIDENLFEEIEKRLKEGKMWRIVVFECEHPNLNNSQETSMEAEGIIKA